MITRELADYTLIKQLGRGPLGTVFLAEHRFLKKQYAIKVLPEELAMDRSFMQRFQEEVGRLAALQHPHLVAIHNVSFHDGVYFLVTDCIVDEMGESTNLFQYLKTHEPLDEESLWYHLSQIGAALDYAHGFLGEGKGLVHRGLKLNNILVGRNTEGTAWFLSDFGLSRLIGCGAVLTRTFKSVAETLASPALWAQAASEEARYPFPPLDMAHLNPLHHSFLQTFAFLAPEQKCIDGVHPIDFKADVYAFGVLTYYLLTGLFPEGFFPMPSQLRQDLTMDWDSLIRNCLHLKAEHRSSVLVDMLSSIKNAEDSIWQSQESIAKAYQINSRVHETAMIGAVERPVFDADPGAIFQTDTTVKHYQPERREMKSISPLISEAIVIPAGTYWRGSVEGSRDEQPCHQVHLDSFAMDIHPVTNEQFVRFLELMGGEKDSCHRDLIRLRDSRIKRSGGKLSIESGYSKHPVVGVTWYGAMAYAKWVGKRLPTEVEWEIAAAGGAERLLYPTGDDIEKNQANFFSSDTTAVMSYAPNILGLYDMAGNVYEWCQDWYSYNYYESSMQEPDNPKGPLQGNYRVLRGGCWKSLKEDLRCSKRHRNNPGTVNSTYGFRCASDV